MSQNLPAVISPKAWSPDQLALQAWLALPPAARQPRTQRALAAQLEVRESTLSDWKALPGFGDAVAKLVREVIKLDIAPGLHACAREAKKGSLPHLQFLCEITGIWTPKQRHELTGEDGGPLRLVMRVVEDRVD